MENIEQNLSLTKKKLKRNETNQIIIEVFGSWNIFRRLVKEGLQNIDYDPLENKTNKKHFTKSILGAYQIPYSYFTKISDLVGQEVKKIRKDTV